MKRLLRLFCLLLAGLLWQAPAAAQAWGDAARVNGEPITNLRLERFFEDFVKDKNRNIGRMINPRVYKKLKRDALDALIEREVLWQAANKAGITVDAAEVDAAMRTQEAAYRSREHFLIKLEEAGFDEASYREHLRRELTGARFLQRATEADPAVSADEVDSVYARTGHTLMLPETARARHILLKANVSTTLEQRAAIVARLEKLRTELLRGADFAELARRHSEDPTAAAGGDLGEFPRGRMVRGFEDSVFALQVGEISEVVQTRFGYHLIKLEAHSPARVPTLEEARERLREQIVAERRTDFAKQLVAQLVADAKVEVLINLDTKQ